MSIATEITRLQGIKTDIRTALVTQGIAQASSHNMADFSADILAIQGSGGEGVYITVTCGSVYQGYDIILSASGSEIERKQCPSSLVVNFFVSANDITLPATFTISNSLNSITTSFEANILGWYDIFANEALAPDKMTSANTPNGLAINVGGYVPYDDRQAWKGIGENCYGMACGPVSGTYIKIAYTRNNGKSFVTKSCQFKNTSGTNYYIIASNDGNSFETIKSGTPVINNLMKIQLDNFEAYKYWGIEVTGGSNTNTPQLLNVQFYGYEINK